MGPFITGENLPVLRFIVKIYKYVHDSNFIMTKILSLVTSRETEKINMALNFSKRQKAAGHDIRILFFGPSEGVLAENEEIKNAIKADFPDSDRPKACIAVAQMQNIDAKLKGIAELVRAGEYITKSIDEGYAVITF